MKFTDLKGCKKHKQKQVDVLFHLKPDLHSYYKNYAEIFMVLNFHFITIVMLFYNIQEV